MTRCTSTRADEREGRRLILLFLQSLEIKSLLDVGSATGRGLKEFAAALPGALVCGAEPVKALVGRSGEVGPHPFTSKTGKRAKVVVGTAAIARLPNRSDVYEGRTLHMGR